MELSRSYRSTPEILHAAAAVLRAAKQPAAAVRATRPSGAGPTVSAHPTDRAEAIAIARAVRRAHAPGRPWAEQAVLVRTHAQTELIAEALRETGIPHRVRGSAGVLDRPAVRKALRDLRAAEVPLGTALSDLELGLDDGPSPIDPYLLDADDADERAAVLAKQTEDRAAVAVVLQMGREYLRLDPLGGAGTFAAWLAATVQSEADSATSGDAVDVATFHAAKGLEWGIVHLAGAEEGFLPVAHARTVAAKAEEARLVYVAMTRAQRELHITWAEQRAFAGRMVDRRRSPLLAPVPDRGPIDTEPLAPPTPPVDDWAEQLVRQRAQLDASRRPASPELDALRHWRDRVARAARVAPEAVLPDHVLARIVDARPADVAELGAVRGVGAILAARFGPDLLETLRSAAPGPVGR